MTIAVAGTGILAPSFTTGWILLAAILTIAAYVVFHRIDRQLLPPRLSAADRAGALRSETPAVVNLLANDATVTASGLRATVVDLAARGWLRILPPDDEVDELARVRPAATAYRGDSLRPHERLVLQHVMARFTTDRAIPARYLAVDTRGSWWRRYAGLVVDDARDAGLIRRRWTRNDLVVPVALLAAGAIIWLVAWSTGSTETAVIDSQVDRIIGWTVAAAIGVMIVRVIMVVARPTYTHTDAGVSATERWLAIRARLAENGFADIAPSAIETGDRRLAYATAMCLADGARVELPLAREDHHRVWSTVGGHARLVRVSYPARIAYGTAPFVAIALGLVMCFLGLRLQRWADDVARGKAFDWAYERVPEQSWLVADVATALALITFVPILAGLWMALAGAADGFRTIERTGAVVRVRRPAEVSPLPRTIRKRLERDRYRVYIAIDDGTTDTITAWKTGERNAVPQGARATVRATPVLGHVRSATPVGHVLVG